MLRRLKIKFICINMLIVTSMMAVIFGMVLYFTSKNVEQQGAQMLQRLHQMQYHKPQWELDNRTPYFMVQFSRSGTITISANQFFSQTTEEELEEIARIAYADSSDSGVLWDHNLRYSRQRTPFGERIVFIDVSRDRVILQDLLKICGIIGLSAIAVFFGISVALANWAIKPVDDAWKQQKQFVADASHELKTPLTVILTNAELLNGSNYDDASRMQFIQSIHAMAIQMRGLVEGLLDLARLDNGITKMELSEVDFSQLAADSILPFEPMYFEKGLELTGQIEGNLRIRGSKSHLQQVLDILLDNALKYADPVSPIRICLIRQGNVCQLSVSSSGDEISKEDLKNIFKRFYRIDKVRSMNHSYGLGLSIAAGIVEEHNGKIWAESENGINVFLVQLPLLR